MKRKGPSIILIYTLIFIIIVLIVLLTKIVVESNPKPERKSTVHIEKLEMNPYPNVNDECTFNLTYLGYNALTMAGCKGGYTRYDISDVILNGSTIPVSVIYSDKNKIKVGIFINNKRVTNNIDSVTNIKFGIFDNKLFILDTNNNEANALAFDSKGNQVYNLKEVLENSKIKDLSTGDTEISSATLDPTSYSFTEGVIEFSSIANECKNNEKSKGSHYKVTYNNSNFEKPEFINLVNCN